MRPTGELYALGTAVSWSIGSNLFAGAGRRMSPTVLNRLRILIATVLLATTLVVTRGSAWPWWVSRSQTGWLALSGLVGFVFGDLQYFRAMAVLGAGRASLLASLSPLFTVLIAWPLLHEVPGPMAALGIALTLGGVGWVLFERQQGAHERITGPVAAGVVAGILAALGQSAGYVISRQVLGAGVDAVSATVIRVLAATAAMWLWALIRGEAGRTLGALGDRAAAAFTAGGAIFGPFLGVMLSLAALRTIPAGIASSIIAFYPVLTILISSRLHHEPLTWRTMIGALVAVAGVVVLFQHR